MMETCLRSLREKFQLLRTRVVKVSGDLYFAEVDSHFVDFERVDGGFLRNVNALLNMEFTGGGPLWRARLLHLNPVEAKRESSDRGEYKYYLFFSIFHMLIDGTTDVVMLNKLMEFLDATLCGAVVDVSPTVQQSPSQEELINQREFTWPEIKPLLVRALNAKPETSLWCKCIPADKAVESRSQFVDGGCLTVSETAALVSRCKQEGVTVNSALATAMNIAFFNFYRKHGRGEEKIEIKSAHMVNMRRFMGDKDVCGFNVQVVRLSLDVTDQTIDTFWRAATEMQTTLRKIIYDENFVKKVVTVDTVLIDADKLIASMRENPVSTVDYCLSNMMDIGGGFSGIYSNLAVDWLTRSTNMRYYGFPFLFNANTFRSSLLLSCGVMSEFSTPEVAESIAEDVLSVVRHVIK